MAWTPEQRKKYFQCYTNLHKDDPTWKASTRNRQRRKRHKMKKLLVAALGGKCIRCGFSEHIFALEFDHLDPISKQCDPSYLISSSTYKAAYDYITANCQLLCANCHALKTVAYADNLRGTNISDTTSEKALFKNPDLAEPEDIEAQKQQLYDILNPRPVEHGTTRMFGQGCRCVACREITNTKAREYYHRTKKTA